MPKELLKKYMPDADLIRNHKNLQFLGKKLHDPNLLHLNRHSVAIAFAVGLFCAWIPTPMQMALAAVGAFYFRGHLPIAVALVWLTNPITMPALFYFAYRVGLFVLNMPTGEFSLTAILSSDLWIPFLTGCLILAVSSAMTGYFTVQAVWHYQIAKKWQHRQHKRSRKAANPFKSTH